MSMKWLLIGLASVAALGAFSMSPAVAQATPQFRINGVLAGAGKTNVVQFGTITMKSPFFGEIKCKVIVGAPVSNESEKGVAAVEDWEPYGCQMPECVKGGSYVTAEAPPELVAIPERGEQPVRSNRFMATKGHSRPNLPWPAELSTPEAGRTALNTRFIQLYVLCPAEQFEVLYEGELVPAYVNGSKNGLKPSHLEFEGSGGKTGHLLAPVICGGTCEQADLFFSGGLTAIGTNQQLVTAEQMPPPTFAGLKAAHMCFPGLKVPETAAVKLSWEAATDGTTPSGEIVYNVYQATTSGGENYSAPTYTTAPGMTQFETPQLRTSEKHFFVVRARDKAGLEDSNTVEAEAQNICV
jgi:hypothetical protein